MLAAAIRAGADREALLGAAFGAGVLDIRPRSVGGKLHAVMMVESAFQLIETAPSERDAWLSAIWAVDDFKVSQGRDRREGDWVLPARPEVAELSAAAARTELVAALEAWDAERADRALVALFPQVDREQLFEILWPYAARCYVDLGHKVIFATQVERVLARLSWSDADDLDRGVERFFEVPPGQAPRRERLPVPASFPSPSPGLRPENKEATKTNASSTRARNKAGLCGVMLMVFFEDHLQDSLGLSLKRLRLASVPAELS